MDTPFIQRGVRALACTIGEGVPEGSEKAAGAPPVGPRITQRFAAWVRAYDWLKLIELEPWRKRAINIFILASFGFLFFAIWKDVGETQVVWDSIAVPKEMEERGLSGDVIAQRLTDQMHNIVHEIQKRVGLRGSHGEEASPDKIRRPADKAAEALANIKVPEAGISLQSVIMLLRRYFGPDDTRLGGSVSIDRPILDWAGIRRYSMVVRIEMNGDRIAETLVAYDLDTLIDKAAHKLVQQLDPYTIAADHLYHRQWHDMDSWIDTILRNPKKDSHKYALNLRGVAYQSRNESAEAIRHFQMALELDPTFAFPYLNWGNTLVAQGLLAEAFEQYRKAVRLPGRQEAVFRAWAIAARQSPSNDLCAAELKREALGTIPEGAISFGADLWDQDACWTLAIDRFRRALAFETDRSSTLNSLGVSYNQRKQLDLAAEYYERAVEADRGNALAWRNWGLLLADSTYRKHNAGDAEKKFRHAIEANRTYVAAHLDLANLLKDRGDTADAIQQYQMLVVLDPTNANSYRDTIRTLQQTASK